MQELAKDPNAVIVFQDEVHFCVQTTIRAQWGKTGRKIQVRSNPKKESVSYSGFVIYGTGRLLTIKLDWFNYETTIAALREFLKRMPLKAGQKVYMVMDNAPWHKKAKRLISDKNEGEYTDLREQIIFIDMPSYSPDLNPIEQVWRLTRREVTHNRYFPTITALFEVLEKFFSRFTKPNRELSSLCTFNFQKKRKTTNHRPRKIFRSAAA